MPKQKKYTKEQLIIAQCKYNTDVIENPNNYEKSIDPYISCAESQIEYLLSFIDE